MNIHLSDLEILSNRFRGKERQRVKKLAQKPCEWDLGKRTLIWFLINFTYLGRREGKTLEGVQAGKSWHWSQILDQCRDFLGSSWTQSLVHPFRGPWSTRDWPKSTLSSGSLPCFSAFHLSAKEKAMATRFMRWHERLLFSSCFFSTWAWQHLALRWKNNQLRSSHQMLLMIKTQCGWQMVAPYFYSRRQPCDKTLKQLSG